MKEEKLLVTMKDMQRYRVFKDVIDKKLKGFQAAEILGLPLGPLTCLSFFALTKLLL